MSCGTDPDLTRADACLRTPAAAIFTTTALSVSFVMGLAGCAATTGNAPVADVPVSGHHAADATTSDDALALVVFEDEAAAPPSEAESAEDRSLDLPRLSAPVPDHAVEATASVDSLSHLESIALQRNPKLRRLAGQYTAARARIGYVDGLPDPQLGANVFVSPIETAAGSQRANLTVSQMLPWLERLDAEKQRACFEAMAAQQLVAAEQLRIIADLRELWFRIYVIDRQLEISETNQQLVKDLVDVANARFATGSVPLNDVLAGTLEYGRMEEQLVLLRQRRSSAVVRLNRVAGRDVEWPVTVPDTLKIDLPPWSPETLRQLAAEYQPTIQSARLRTQATRWGIEVARLQRRPDVSISASWFEIDGNRPVPNIVDVGQDAWALGATVSIPLWEQKYRAMENEARWKHSSAHAGVEELVQQFDAQILDLWQQAVAASETAELYEDTILPQAQHTLQADQQAYATGTVEFDRVVQDARNLLTLQMGYHAAQGRLAIALARLEQAVGTRPQ